MSPKKAIIIGFSIAFGLYLVAQFVRRAPDIAIAWGNAWAEHERRMAAEAPFRAQEQQRNEDRERKEAERREANAAYNEANCKVIITAGFWDDQQEVITGMRSIDTSLDGDYYILNFGGGVSRSISKYRVLKTENCR